MKPLNKIVIETLNNVGAISENRALTIEEISKETSISTEDLKEVLKELKSMGYVKSTIRRGRQKYFLTPTGILVALSSYS